MRGEFRGWIPTVTGRLSFSAIGMTDGQPGRCVTSNISDGRSRYILCYQSRMLGDSVLPPALAQWLFKLRGQMWFACVARAVQDSPTGSEKLVGHVFLISNKKVWRSEVEAKIRTEQFMLSDYRRNMPFNSKALKEYFNERYCNLATSLAPLSDFSIAFEVARTGETIIRHDSTGTSSPGAPGFPHDKEGHLLHVVIAQFFFFLKDIFHQHQHHDPKTDTILDIYRADGDDHQWRRETLYALYRKIISYKRKNTERNLFSALGVLAYAQSFEKLSRLKCTQDDLPVYNTQSLEMSLQAARDEVVWKNEGRNHRLETRKTVFLPVIGLIISMAGLLQVFPPKYPDGVTPSASPQLVRMMEWLAIYPGMSAASIVAAFILFGMYWGWVDYLDNSLIRKLVRILQPLKQKVSSLIFLGSAASLAVALLYFAFAA